MYGIWLTRLKKLLQLLIYEFDSGDQVEGLQVKWLKYAYRKGISSNCEINFGHDVAVCGVGPFSACSRTYDVPLSPVAKFSITLMNIYLYEDKLVAKTTVASLYS